VKNLNPLLCFVTGVLFGYFANSFLNNTAMPVSTSDNTVKYIETQLTSNKNSHRTNHKEDGVDKHITEKAQTVEITNINTAPNNQNKFSRLSSQMDKLTEKYQDLQNKYKKTNIRLKQVTFEIESLDESDITDEQMMLLADDTFAEFRRGYRGKQRDKIFDFHKQKEDLDWGYDMQTKISDFILTHYNANGVQLFGVSCKQVNCEILINELEKNSWNLTSQELRKQAWWKFTSTTSTSRSGENDSQLIYLFMSK